VEYSIIDLETLKQFPDKVNNMEDLGEKKTLTEKMKESFSRTVEEELTDDIAFDDIAASVVLIVVNVLVGLHFLIHQMSATDFFTASFGAFEMLFLYGIFLFWIVTSVLMLLGQKNASRDLDSFGGLFFATIGIVWLLVVFPFDFAFFADVSPDFLRILIQWISNDIARLVLVVLFILHLIAAVYSFALRVAVWKARSKGR
jgi:hypothetical protein